MNEKALVSVVSESLPHLKRGAIKDLKDILLDMGMYNEKMHNKTDQQFQIGSSVIEFFGADQPDKLRGAARDYLFINECNNVSKAAFDQLEPRTRKQIYLDYNPTSEFWVHTEVIPIGAKYIHSTWRDNPFLEQSIINSIERRKETDSNWYKVYGLGEVGELEGRIYDFDIVLEVPQEAKHLGYGLDFGYTNDPTALIAGYEYNGELYLHEVIYEVALLNIPQPDREGNIPDNIHDRMEAAEVGKRDDIIADSADPKSIQELYNKGWNVRGAQKGPDSIKHGIDAVKRYKINVTKESVNLIKEFRNYTWAKDKEGNTLNKPIDAFNHGLDSLRYLIDRKPIGKILA